MHGADFLDLGSKKVDKAHIVGTDKQNALRLLAIVLSSFLV